MKGKWSLLVHQRYKSWSDDVDGATEPSNSNKQSIVSHSHCCQLFLIRQFILLYHCAVIEIIPYFFLLKHVE